MLIMFTNMNFRFVGLRVTNGSGTPLYALLFGIIIIALPILYFANQPATKKGKSKKGNLKFNEEIGYN